MLSKECSIGSLNKMKIILVIWKAALGGIEKTILDYLEYLGNEFNFTVFSLRPISENHRFFSVPVNQIIQGHRFNFLLYAKFLRYTIKNKDQIFHLFNAGPIILLITRLLQVKKIIYHIHGTIYWKSSFQKFIRKMFWKLAFFKIRSNENIKFLANSSFSSYKFKHQIFSKVDIEILYNPINTNRFYPIKKPQSDRIRIFYVGRLVRGKNLFLWIDIAEHILKYYSDIEFEIVGEGILKNDLLRTIKEKKLEATIKVSGFVDRIEKVYQYKDLLLFLSEYESFGNVVVESILCGTPVIVSSIPAMQEIFKDYPEFLVEINDNISDEIIDKLKYFDRLKGRTVKARNDFLKRFNMDTHLQKIRELYVENAKKIS